MSDPEFALYTQAFGHEADVRAVAADAQTLFSASRDRSVRAWRLGSDTVAQQVSHTQPTLMCY